jgi:hypothetical protein
MMLEDLCARFKRLRSPVEADEDSEDGLSE